MKLKDRIKSEYEGLKDGYKKALIAGLILGATNLSSFSTVAMQRYILKIDNETASVANSLHSVPILYDIGFDLGHTLFYGDSMYIDTAEKVTRFNNIWPRPYIGERE